MSYCDSAVSVVRRPSSTFRLVYVLEATVLVQLSWNFVRMFVLINSQTILKMGHVGSKISSLGQILKKNLLYALEATFLVRLWWNLFRMFVFMKSRSVSNMGHFGLKTRSLGQILKNLVYAPEARFSVWLSWNFVRMFVLMKSQTSLKMGHVGSKTRSQRGQVLEKPCVCSRGHIFCLIIMKLGLNVCLDKISDKVKLDHVRSKTRSLGQILEKNLV